MSSLSGAWIEVGELQGHEDPGELEEDDGPVDEVDALLEQDEGVDVSLWGEGTIHS